jgi:hypothetical protein
VQIKTVEVVMQKKYKIQMFTITFINDVRFQKHIPVQLREALDKIKTLGRLFVLFDLF